MNRVDIDSRIPRIVRNLPDEVDDALRRGAEAIESGAKSRAPVDSGDLRDSIKADRLGVGEYEVASDAFYAHMVEFGTTKAGAQPFLLPAAEAERDNIVKAVTTELNNL